MGIRGWQQEVPCGGQIPPHHHQKAKNETIVLYFRAINVTLHEKYKISIFKTKKYDSFFQNTLEKRNRD